MSARSGIVLRYASRRTAATMPTSTGQFLPILWGSMSIWMSESGRHTQQIHPCRRRGQLGHGVVELLGSASTSAACSSPVLPSKSTSPERAHPHRPAGQVDPRRGRRGRDRGLAGAAGAFAAAAVAAVASGLSRSTGVGSQSAGRVRRTSNAMPRTWPVGNIGTGSFAPRDELASATVLAARVQLSSLPRSATFAPSLPPV